MPRYIFFILLTALAVSCASPRPKGANEAEILFKEAESFIESDRYILGAEKLREIRARFPYGKYAKLSQLKLADLAFKQENYLEAAVAYQGFKDLYPGSDQNSYVLFKLGESFSNQMPKTYDRDLGDAYQAIAYYNQIITRYPNSRYYEESLKKKEYCEQMLRDKEQYIADFYFKTKVYEAARFRYKQILKNFEQSKLLEYSMVRAVESSLMMNDKKACTRDAQAFIDVLNKKESATRNSLRVLKSKCEGM